MTMCGRRLPACTDRQLSLCYHPDKTRIMESSELFQVVKKAYEVLSDETARASYDHRTKGKVFAYPARNKENVPDMARPKPPVPTKPPAAAAAAKPAAPKSAAAERPKNRLSAPHSLRAIELGDSFVTVAWEAVPGAVSYELQTKLVNGRLRMGGCVP
jgi:curved DNA-binding protein CbpA